MKEIQQTLQDTVETKFENTNLRIQALTFYQNQKF